MRKPLALMLAGLMAVSMVGCGSNGDAASSNNKDKADSGKVTLKVTTTYAGEDTNAGNYKDACAAWTKETGFSSSIPEGNTVVVAKNIFEEVF